ncbi:MAG TPA: hypothetical protein VFE98_04110 [Candidatus Bathyarchaeia archaeon]|nr:hypothetical protein [Candidatus Bathyarchaeia archaeon]
MVTDPGTATDPEQEQPDKLLLNIERLTELTVKKLLDGDRDKLLDRPSTVY